MKTSSQMSGLQRTISSERDSLQDWMREPEDCVWLADWRAHKLPYCSIYVISPEGSWPSKIGIAVNARSRVIGLQTSHWKRLVVTHCFWARTVSAARKVEKRVHAILKEEGAYLLGEWFDRRPDQAAEVVKFAAMLESVEIGEKIEDDEVLSSVRKLHLKLLSQALNGPRMSVEPKILTARGIRGKSAHIQEKIR